MTIPYDDNFDPPALVLPAVLSSVVRSRPQVQFPALIDTGAEITAVPTPAIQRLDLYAVGRIDVEDVHARIETVNIYIVRITVGDTLAREIEVVPTEHPFIILGRDWLADFHLYLNGPEEVFLISDSPVLIPSNP